ncbi:MAG TPA: NAD(P)-dependent oxidoreductase [Spirochaetia bacterium]|nr:NAD(P)-dependent oxidoreductase [Spirochaetia bacterium]
MVLVTGATGFIGAALVSRFSETGRVLACDYREPDSALAQRWGGRVEFEKCDVRDANAVRSLVQKAGKEGPVIHLAGILTAGCDLNPEAAIQVNLQGFFNVIDASSKAGKGPVVLASTIGVYGRGLPQPIDETMRTEPDGWYGYTKLSSELMGLLYERREGVDFRAVRFAAVTGAGRSASSGSASLFTSFIAEKAARGEPYEIEVTEDTAYPVVYIRDAVDALFALATAKNAPRRIYNVSSGRVIVSEMIDYVRSRIPGAKFSFKPSPVVMAVVSGYKEWDIGCDRIREDLGWKPSFGVQAMIDDIIDTVRGGK